MRGAKVVDEYRGLMRAAVLRRSRCEDVRDNKKFDKKCRRQAEIDAMSWDTYIEILNRS